VRTGEGGEFASNDFGAVPALAVKPLMRIWIHLHGGKSAAAGSYRDLPVRGPISLHRPSAESGNVSLLIITVQEPQEQYPQIILAGVLRRSRQRESEDL